MKKSIAREWVKALRSEDFTQTMTDEERFQPEGGRVEHDPIGVLGELCEYETDEEVFKEKRWQRENGTCSFISKWDTVVEWAGLDLRDRGGRDRNIIEAVVEMHDAGQSFGDIADFLEDSYEVGNEEV